MFAIIDIETTGGQAFENSITEIAIVLHNGVEMEGKYETLVNPLMPIQKYVQSLTGITDAMVAQAPLFKSIAPNVFNLLKDRVFVAHNVSFDYSYVKHQLQRAGFILDVPKVCTINLAKKIFPGLPKYGLESISKEFNLNHNDKHRAAGDALVTAELFEILVKNDKNGELQKMINHRAVEKKPRPKLFVKK